MVDAWQGLLAAESDLEAAREMLSESTGDDRPVVLAEVTSAEEDIERLTGQLRTELLPRDPNAGRNVIVEIRGGEGGDEAKIFAKDLYDMYTRYAAQKGWKVEVLSESPSELGGLDGVTFLVKGR